MRGIDDEYKKHVAETQPASPEVSRGLEDLSMSMALLGDYIALRHIFGGLADSEAILQTLA